MSIKVLHVIREPPSTQKKSSHFGVTLCLLLVHVMFTWIWPTMSELQTKCNSYFLLSLSNLSAVFVQGRVIDRHSAVDAPDGAVSLAVATEGDDDDEIAGEDDGRQKK